MKRGSFWLTASALSTVLILGGCSSSGGGSVEGTTISGKVTLSGVVSSKPAQRLQKMSAVPKGKPGTTRYKAMAQKTGLQRYEFMPTRAAGDTLANAIVYLYDASHPEWLYPVAQTTTDANGNYTLDRLANAAKNGNAYNDGDPIPAGKYTLLAIGVDPVTLKPSIALESVVQEFSGNVNGEELVAQDSTATPEVVTMVGVKKNPDGTQTWGGPDLELPVNAAIQVTFSMAMNRDSVQNGISIQPPVDGYWAVSADWLSATFYLNDGAALTPGQTYTVTVAGEDTSDTPVRNVYGNALQETATGTFTVAQNVDETAPQVALASPATTTDVDITTPIRVSSNEPLDVNTLRLSATPSLGAQPGVMYIGKDGSNYVYEFMLGEPLKLGQSYQIQISGGTDLAGNEMTPIDAAFTTTSTSAGIDPASDAAADQADVKDVFGRWVRALNDRNLAQMSALMAGDFIMEYDTTAMGGFDPNDINRDGALDLGEFSDMLAQVFPIWDYCGTTVTGEIVDTINVVAGQTADFEFRLLGDSMITSQDCKDLTPKDSLFVTLNKYNESWIITRASEGIDTRGQSVQLPDYLALLSPDDGFVMDPLAPDANIDPVTGEPVFNFQWTEVEGASAYVMIFVDAREPRAGFAFILPPTFTSMDIPPNESLFQGVNPVAAEVSEDFGFDMPFVPRPGAEIYWQVAALSTNTVQDVLSGRNTDLVRDVMAMSEVRGLQIAGEYVDMTVLVSADTDGDGTTEPLTYNELMGGYDAGSAASLTLDISTPDLSGFCLDPNATGWNGIVRVSGYTYQESPVPFQCGSDENGNPLGTAQVTVSLNQDWNWVEIVGAYDPADPEVEPQALRRGFVVQTSGGIAPAIAITSVVDDQGTNLVDDGWNYYQAPGTKNVTINGTVDTAKISGDLFLNLWNDILGASASQTITPAADGTFSVTVPVYQGDNWIDISHEGTPAPGTSFVPWYSVNLGVYTDTGTAYTPPIEITLVEGNDPNDGLVVKNETWPNGANYDASAVTSNVVVIEGVFNDLSSDATPRYDVGSDGGWEGGDLYVAAADGTFRLVVELYNGWNYVGLTDGQDAWYSLNLYTDSGRPVVRPQITTVDGNAYAGGDVTTAACEVTLSGTAEEGPVYVYWSGNDGQGNFYWEDLSTIAVDNDSDGLGEFSVTVPLVSGGDNFVDINDAQYRWTGVRIVTTGTCAYTPPTLTFGGVSDINNSPLPEDPSNPGQYDAGAESEVKVFGTHSKPGRTIRARQWVCGGEQMVEETVDANGDWILTVPLYDQFNGIEVTDGVNFQFVNVVTTNPQPATPAMAVTSVTLDGSIELGAPDNQGCEYADYLSDTALANATSVTIGGTSQNGAGTGQYNGNGVNSTFTINADGSFTINNVPLYDGFNFISVCDAAWSCYNLSLQTSNGVQPPAYVSVTSPAPGASVSGDVTITGTIDFAPSNGVAWSPDVVMANVDWCDTTGVCQWISFSSDPNAPADVLPIDFTIDTAANTGTFSFTVPGIPADTPVNVNVFADDNSDPANFVSHGVNLTLNDPFATEAFYFKAKERGVSLADEVKAMQRRQALRAKIR